MEPETFSSFLRDAVLLDWERQRDRQAPVASALSEGSTVRVVTDAGTDIRFDITDMEAVNDYGQVNLPGGEVYTAPVVDSVDGTVRFDLPVSIDGRELTGIRATFEDGDLVDLAADAHEPFLRRLLDIDAGASRLGEFGIGMNAQLDRVTRNMALDEKMMGTVHFAFGTAYETCVGEENVRNESAIHVDLLVDMRKGSRLEVDGAVVQRDGNFQLD
jgi:aminopeptidase